MKTQENDNWFACLLLSWYAEHGRELPWRQTKDAYRVWLSEIILQQTRVEQGWDYYLRFIDRFPTVEALADASLDEVLRLWQGLGYYSRARNLHTAAQQVVAMGGFPRDYAGVRGLKGVGDYTAAAIASFAYDQPYAVVDGNVYRVLSRCFCIEEPIDTGKGRRLFADLAQQLIDKAHPADCNQAIMDLGATVCTPRNPQCDVCPLASRCEARNTAMLQSLPRKVGKIRVRDRYFTYFYLQCGDEVLLQQRGEGDIWQGLYQLPLVETDGPMSNEDVVRLPWLKDEAQCVAQGVRHQLSHQLLHADCYVVRCAEKPDLQGQWVNVGALAEYAVSRLVELLLQRILH